MLHKRILPLFLSLFLILGLIVMLSSCSWQEEKVDFNAEIRPILNQKCMRCHGGVKRNGELSLLFREEALKPAESGLAAIVPGNVKKSELINRITHTDPELRMPYEGSPLSEKEVDLFKKWIQQGAQWEAHWAYIAPEQPEIPSTSQEEWIYNSIDPFVAAKLDLLGLKGAPAAEPAELVRRLSLDLRGLPPTYQEVQRLEKDNSIATYEQLVDSFLASPQYGERWAAMWLDLARYADSKGYEKDPYRSIWKYRDWVIKAFNANMPYDEFTHKQLAGDLLKNPTTEDLIATSFHRNTMNNTEGGTEDEEFRVAAVIDRVNTTWTVWQGTTMECVQCHSHPYDPFRQQDYYTSYAFFNQSKDEDLDGEFPVMETFGPKEDSTIKSMLSQLKQWDQKIFLEETAPLSNQIKQAIYPRIRVGDCDGWEDVELNHQLVATNWARNPNNIPNKNYYLYYRQLDLKEVEQIAYRFNSAGELGRIELRLDHPDGPLHQALDLPFSKQPIWLSGSVEPLAEPRDVYLRMVNKGVNDPKGRFNLMDMYMLKAGEEIDEELIEEQDELLALRWKATRFPIMQERSSKNKRTTQEFIRGNWMSPGDTITQPDVPGSLSDFPDSFDRNRMGFAQWLTDPGNPLTARVMVNRMWEQLFGRGLVETVEDFGTQGAKPTHPELLDWLAVYFQEDLNWDMKALLKTIVMSSTYRQSSRVGQGQLDKDPENRLLSRGPRVRLTAEQIRDQALALSGLLSTKMYGKPVMPPQPDKVWQSVYNNEKWETSTGENRHRRAIYTYWKRTSPYPSMVSFDTPSREFCVSRRIPTNTPLQALVTLNDPVFIEAAEYLAQQMMQEGTSLEEHLAYGYRRVLFKSPSEATLNTLKGLYQDVYASYREGRTTGEFVIEKVSDVGVDTPKLAAMSVVASALLNLDSVIMKE